MRLKLFCKHKYKFYGATEYYPFMSIKPYTRYNFVCPLCGKETHVDGSALAYELKRECSRQQKTEALGKIYGPDENSQYKYESIAIYTLAHDWGELYEGKFVDSIKQRYLALGINLDEID